jgi:hypothetical protein
MATNSISEHKWVVTFRIVTMSIVLSVGGFASLVLFGGQVLGITPFEPPSGVSPDEHMRRIDTGYYTVEGWNELGILVAYLAVVAIPHRWIVRSRIAVAVATVVLALPLLWYLGDFVCAIIEKRHDREALLELFHPVNVVFDTLCILFCLMIPLSLLFSWRYRNRSDTGIQSKPPVVV